jgi:hypothetical protein
VAICPITPNGRSRTTTASPAAVLGEQRQTDDRRGVDQRCDGHPSRQRDDAAAMSAKQEAPSGDGRASRSAIVAPRRAAAAGTKRAACCAGRHAARSVMPRPNAAAPPMPAKPTGPSVATSMGVNSAVRTLVTAVRSMRRASASPNGIPASAPATPRTAVSTSSRLIVSLRRTPSARMSAISSPRRATVMATAF